MDQQFLWFALWVVAIAVFIIWRMRRRWAVVMRGVAQAYDLRLEPRMWGLGLPAAVGQIDGHRVRLAPPTRPPSQHDQQTEWFRPAPRKGKHTFVELRITPRRPVTIAISPEVGRLGRLLVGRDVTCGDAWFDELARLEGDPTAILSVLDADARRRIGALIERGGRVSGGDVVLAWVHQDSVPRAADMVQIALQAVNALQPGGTARDRLAVIARDDVKGTVRRTMLVHLVERHRNAPETRAALEAGLDDIEPAVRLVAARAIGPAGHATLVALAATDHPEPIRVTAVEALAESEAGLDALSRLVTQLPGAAGAAARAALKGSGLVAVGGLALADVEGGGLMMVDRPDSTE